MVCGEKELRIWIKQTLSSGDYPNANAFEDESQELRLLLKSGEALCQ